MPANRMERITEQKKSTAPRKVPKVTETATAGPLFQWNFAIKALDAQPANTPANNMTTN